jgi:hypothetical protein
VTPSIGPDDVSAFDVVMSFTMASFKVGGVTDYHHTCVHTCRRTLPACLD